MRRKSRERNYRYTPQLMYRKTDTSQRNKIRQPMPRKAPLMCDDTKRFSKCPLSSRFADTVQMRVTFSPAQLRKFQRLLYMYLGNEKVLRHVAKHAFLPGYRSSNFFQFKFT